MLTSKPRIEITARVLLIVVMFFNALVPTAAFASSSQEANSPLGSANEADPNTSTTLLEQRPVYFDPPQLSYPQQTSPEPEKGKSRVPLKDQVEFTLVAEPAVVPVNGPVKLNVYIRNNSEQALTSLVFTDPLENGLEYSQDSASPVTFDPQKKDVSLTIASLATGEEFTFSYSMIVTSSKQNEIKGNIWLHDARLSSNESNLNLKTGVAFGVELPMANAQSELAPLQSNGGWNALGRIAIYMEKESAGKHALVMSSPTKITGKGPELQFNLDVFETDPISVDSLGKFNEQTIKIKKEYKDKFKIPAFLEINLDGYVDLQNVPAGQEPYVATYDEINKIWVKVPVLEVDHITNSVTVEAVHFSTWGAGLGSSLPQNGANVLLFDQPYTSLFTGAARYSIPVWTPPGRAGLAPDVSLSYSSSTVDGVLGDVQAPWVGVGWNIDGVEIVRKITTDENGYGYKNEFALTLNGALYQLVRDDLNQNRYFTDQAAFLYVERHNFALNNNPSTANTTAEWWEVVTTDGTRYRLGWNDDSEQLALMYGYSCTTNGLSCVTPDGAYASLGYAGKARDLVAMRWRVDRVSDTHGNYLEYHYSETSPDSSTTIAPFDRESYLQSISYTGFDDPDGIAPDLAPAYQIYFNSKARSDIGDVPTEFNIWDNLDSRYLSDIWSCLGVCELDGDNAIRKYQFGYSLASVPNSNGSLTLTSLKISGGGYTENGQSIPTTSAPTIRFTYQDKDNRAAGNGDVFRYPRLTTIQNGSGGILSFTYAHDNRLNNSWYNYRVQNVVVESGMGIAKKQGYTYATPVYNGQGGDPNLGSLIGYPIVTESLLDFANSDAAILKTKHTFGTTGLDVGRELQTEWFDNVDTALRKTTNVYVTDNAGAPKNNNGVPFPGWNYRYLQESASYEKSGTSLPLISKNTYYRDPYNGNLLVQSTYVGNSLYRKTYYEYLPNPNPQYYILDKASRVLLVNGSNQIYSDTRYHYDGQINQAPTRGDVTLIQKLTGKPDQLTQTVDTVTSYNIYGNAISVKAYRDYGTVNSYPTSAFWESSTIYDSVQNDPTQSYPVTFTNALEQSTSTAYLHSLGAPYQTTNPNGWTTSTTYDGLGRTLSVTPPGLNQEGTLYIYPSPDSNGNISAPNSVEMQILDTIAGRYRSVWGIYDGAGRMIQTQVDAGNELLVNSTLFNAQGLARQQSLPYYVDGLGGNYTSDLGKQFTTTLYDPLGRVMSVTAPGNIVSETSYEGLTTTVTDPEDNKISRTTDGLGRMTVVAELSDETTVYATTTYFYDAADRLVRVRDAEFNTTQIQYDWLGRKLEMDDPDMGVWTYDYDPLGNMNSQTDNRNCQLLFEYDALNRLKAKNSTGTDCGQEAQAEYFYDSDDLATVEYDPIQSNQYGLRTGMIDASGSTAWSYANFGRTATETRTIGGEQHSITTNSDWLGRPVSTTYDDGEIVSNSYDELGRPNRLESNQETNPIVDLAYNVLGQIETQTLGNGTVITNSYDFNAANNTGTARLTNRTAENGSLIQLDLSYLYDSNGNITHLIDNQLNETQFYHYDFLNRLTSAVGAEGTSTVEPANPETYGQKFEYDQVGNILQVNNWGTPPSLAQDQDNLSDFSFVNFTAPKVEAAAKGLLLPAYQSEPTETPTETPTATATPSAMETPSPTSTDTMVVTATSSPTASQIGTATKTPTPSLVPTNTLAATIAPSMTPTPRLDDAYTVALLHMNGANGSTTFTDESGKVWTAAGNAKIDTSQPKFGGASGLFDGTGDYITAPDHDDFYLSNSDWTIDFWVKFNQVSGSINLVSQYQDSANWMDIWTTSSGRYLHFGHSYTTQFTAEVSFNTNTWYHVAIMRDGVSPRIAINGIQQTVTETTAISGKSLSNISGPLAIGAWNASDSLNGRIDEFRFSKGIARWTTNFTPPAAEYAFSSSSPTPTPTPGVDNAYTSALLHMNGADGSTMFEDETGKAWTAAGNAQSDTDQLRWGNASAFFDGNGDYITTSDHDDFYLSNGNWTLDFWVRFKSNPLGKNLVSQYQDSNNWMDVWVSGDGTKLYFGHYAGGYTAQFYANVPFSTNTWYHVAIMRNGNSPMIAINGVQQAVTEVTTISGKSLSNISGSFIIGAYPASGSLDGWIDEFRFSKGIARWTSNFTPPAAEYVMAAPDLPNSLMAHWNFENVTGTAVPDVATYDAIDNAATLQNGASIISNGANGSAVDFDGSNDFATITDQAEIKKNGSFTLSAWINPSSIVTDRTQYIVNKGTSATDFDYGFITTSTSGTATPTPPANVDANGKLIFRVGDLTPNKVIGPVLPINTWTLVTGVYDSVEGELRLYINGTLTAVEKVSGSVGMGAGELRFSGLAPNQYHGKLDEVRFYKRALTDLEVTELSGEFEIPTPPGTTPTATPTAQLFIEPQWGTGSDGNITINAGETYNINTSSSKITNRTCPDAVTYSVITLASSTANLSTAPTTDCLKAGDEVMLINLESASASDYSAGAYEFLRIASVNGSSVAFTTMKLRWYGEGWQSDSNIGVGADQPRVMLMRVPNYANVTVNGNGRITANAFDGYKGGVLAFHVADTLSGAASASISADALGFTGGSTNPAVSTPASGYSPGYNGINDHYNSSNGGGGGYATAGGGGSLTYGSAPLNVMFFGSGGGGSGVSYYYGYYCGPNNSVQCWQYYPGAVGARGGGMISIVGKTINFSGSIQAKGGNTDSVFYGGPILASGGGAGGSIRIEGNTITLGTTTANGGAPSEIYGDSVAGGLGRIAIYYSDSLSNSTATCAQASLYCQDTA